MDKYNWLFLWKIWL